MTKPEQFIYDYYFLTRDLFYKLYQYSDLPTGKELKEVLKAKNNLAKAIDTALEIEYNPIQTFFLTREPGYKFHVFSIWHKTGDRMNESIFDSLEDAVEDKFNRILEGIYSSRR